MNILLDMIKLRAAMIDNPGLALPEAYFYPSLNTGGLKTIRELATFSFTCRRCEDAPCINVCPAEALEKDTDGLICRHTNLCVSCKSCVAICPFGTIMTDFFRHHRNKDLFHDLKDRDDVAEFLKKCPAGCVTLTEADENPDEKIYRLNDMVLIKEHLYKTEAL